jgi:hypothetical protein
MESVDHLAQMEQIVEAAKSRDAAGGVYRRALAPFAVPVGPVDRNQRSAAVRQNRENEADTTPPHAVDHRERLAFEGVPFTGDGHPRRKILVMGSVWWCPLAAFRMRSY